MPQITLVLGLITAVQLRLAVPHIFQAFSHARSLNLYLLFSLCKISFPQTTSGLHLTPFSSPQAGTTSEGLFSPARYKISLPSGSPSLLS